jgi:hypothetical protein
VTCWTSSSSRSAFALALLASLAACAGARTRRPGLAGEDGRARVALLPLHNLAGARVDERDIARGLEVALARAGLEVVSGDAVEEFLARHRLRYTGGVDGPAAVAARDELGVDGVIVTSLGLYTEEAPPKIGLTMRLVSAGEDPSILWMDSAAAAGDESPGLFGLGLTSSVQKLQREVVSKLSRSLVRFLDAKEERSAPPCQAEGTFEPRVAFRSAVLHSGAFSVAVLPFVDQTRRRNAGEAVALEFVRHLTSFEGVRVLEPGVVRRVMLGVRIIQEGGVSLDHARLLTDILEADVIVAGTVRDYDDRGPVVDFTALAIHRRGRHIVWESTSRNRGDDPVTLFGLGRIGTSSALTCRMVRNVVDGMMGPRPRAKLPPASSPEQAAARKGEATQPQRVPDARAQLLRPRMVSAHENLRHSADFTL